jgi:DNA-binding response OmpR family regulator
MKALKKSIPYMQKVMVVEDDDDILFVVSFILQRNGYSILPISKGEEAIPEALTYKPDLILFDINLGNSDGRELCLKLKTEYKFTIPILVFSANVHLASTISKYKADGFIPKPFDVKKLVDIVNEKLSHE